MKRAQSLPHQLVLVGKAGWGTEHDALRQAAAQGGGPAAAAALVFPGYVDDADLPALYQACEAFAYPSLYEGFGLPPLEAMACGAPTLVSDAPPMPEVAGDAALIVPATDAQAWAEALTRVLCDADFRRDLAARGPARAARFTWQATAERTLAVYQEAVAGRA
jgi:glycosyltransferase involved in cell wall biosynthesis